MKKSTFKSYFAKSRKETVKVARPSQLRLENLEDRQLLSVTDVASLALAADQIAQYSVVNDASDVAIDVSSVLNTTATRDQNDLDILAANGIDPDKGVTWSQLGKVAGLNLTGQTFESLDLTGLDALSSVTATNCGLTELTVANPKLSTLYVGGNSLVELDLTDCAALTNVQVNDNDLTSLNVAGLSKLQILNCADNSLESLDLSGCSKLSAVALQGNDFGGYLNFSATPLTSLSFSSANLKNLVLNHESDVEVKMYGVTDVTVMDSDFNDVNVNIKDGCASFKLTADNMDPITITSGSSTIVVNPLVIISETEGTILAEFDTNVALADVLVTGEEVKVSITGKTVEQSSNYVALVDGRLIYKSGLDVSATPYVINVTAGDKSSSQTVEFALTIQNAPVLEQVDILDVSTTQNTINVEFAGVEGADSYDVYLDGSLVIADSETTFELANLDPNTEYLVAIVAKGERVIESRTEFSATTDMATAATPELEFVSATTDSITIYVSSDDEGAVYSVYVDGEFVVAGARNEFTIEGLTANTEYAITAVASVEGKYDSADSEALIASTDMETAATPNVDYASSTSDTIMITVDSDDDNALYRIYVDGEFVFETDNHVIAIDNLAPSTEYSITAVAVVEGKYDSDLSAPLIASTDIATAATPELEFVSATTDSITIYVSSDDDDALYSVYVDGEFVVASIGNEITLDGLTPNTIYWITAIASVEGKYDSDLSAPLIALTDMATAATPVVEFVSATTDTITVKVGGEAEGALYMIYVDDVLTVSSTSNVIAIEGLAANTEYSISAVASIEGKYDSDKSEAIVASTDMETAATPVVELDYATSDSIAVLVYSDIEDATYDIYVDGVIVASGAGNEVLIEGLEANTEYSITAIAIVEGMYDSEESEALVVSTEAAKATTPTVDVLDVTTDTISVKVGGSEEGAEYTIYVDGEIAAIGVEGEYVLSGLTPNTEYSITATAIVEGMKTSDASEPIAVTTDMEQTTAPTVEFVSATSSSITIALSGSEEDAEYVVVVGSASYTTTAGEFTIEGLKANTEYTIVVTAQAPNMAVSDEVEIVASTLADVASVELSTTLLQLGSRITASVTPEAAATYEWFYGESEDSMKPLAAAKDGSVFLGYNQLGTYIKVVATFTDGEFAGQTVTTTSPDVVKRAVGGVWLAKGTNITEGTVLTARVGSGTTVTYQWYRGIDAEGSVWKAISGATEKTYTVTKNDASYYLKVVATGVGAYNGSASAVTKETANIDRLTLSTDQPVIGVRVNSTLAPEDSHATYQWYTVDSEGVEKAISGATQSYFWPTAAQTGYQLKVTATYNHGDFVGESYSVTTSGVVGVAVTKITVSTPVPYVGKELVAYTTPVAATTDVQWYRVDADGNETAIDGATGKRYTITAEDSGYFLKVEAIGTGKYVGTVSATTKVAVLDDVPLILSTTAPVMGERVSVTPSTDPVYFAKYQWYVANEDGVWQTIDGATANYFTPSAKYVAKELRVVVTYQKGDYAGLTASFNLEAVGRKVGQVVIPAETIFAGSVVKTYVTPTASTATFQWYRVDSEGVATAIEGATDANYQTTDEDAGYRLKLVATGTGLFVGTSEAITSVVLAPLTDGLDEASLDAIALALI